MGRVGLQKGEQREIKLNGKLTFPLLQYTFPDFEDVPGLKHNCSEFFIISNVTSWVTHEQGIVRKNHEEKANRKLSPK